MNDLLTYANTLADRASLKIKSGQIFAKILTRNDDAGRHGVLIPSDVYSLFPALKISDPLVNKTLAFSSYEAATGEQKQLAYKYYQRYPERRITRLDPLINDQSQGMRLQIVLVAQLDDRSRVYLHDQTNEGSDGRFHQLWHLLTGGSVNADLGAYIVTPLDYKGVHVDDSLSQLLDKFDGIQGIWIESMRAGDTGIGYTLETLFGIKENNDKTADFHGIELKSKRKKENQSSTTGKINLFQQGPVWAQKLTAKERIRLIGMQNDAGLYTCYSQLTTKSNNLNLRLKLAPAESRIDLHKNDESMGHWLHTLLEARLLEKQQRAAFILASEKITKTKHFYCYEELIYCERPSINRLIDLISQNQVVFEFTMSEKPDGRIRNHGYPWRLNRPELLDQLFDLRVKLR